MGNQQITWSQTTTEMSPRYPYAEDKLRSIEYHMHCYHCGYSAMANNRNRIVTLYDIHLGCGTPFNPCKHFHVKIYWVMGNKVRQFGQDEIDDTIQFLESEFYRNSIDSI